MPTNTPSVKHDNLFLSKWADVFGVWILLDSTSQHTYFDKKYMWPRCPSMFQSGAMDGAGGRGGVLSERWSCFVKPAQLRLGVWTKPWLCVVGSKPAK